jgi:hypothetical protein
VSLEKQKLSRDRLKEVLLQETTANLGRDASFLEQQIVFQTRNGTPNWDAHCGITGVAAVRAFSVALDNAQRLYDLDDDSYATLARSANTISI